MSAKNSIPKNKETGKNNRTPSSQSSGIVDAVIIDTKIDLSTYLSLQNVIYYFIDCINSYTLYTGYSSPDSSNLSQSILSLQKHFKAVASLLNTGLQVQFKELFEEAEAFSNSLETLHSSKNESEQCPHAYYSPLVARASHLQWLSVCIMQEIKEICTQK